MTDFASLSRAPRTRPWERRRLKALARNITEVVPPRPGTPVVALEDVQSWTGQVLATAATRQVDGAVKKAREGDVLFGKLRPYLAKAAVVSQESTAVGEFLVLRPGPLADAEFLSYMLRSAPFVHHVTALTSGAKMPRIEWRTLGPTPIPVPSREEQRLIVRYLDNACLSLGRAINAKRHLVELLDERRRAISEKVVTGGLEPATETQVAGVPWLKSVPSHWESRPAKFFFREVDERSTSGREPLMSVSHLTGVTLRSAKNITMFMAASYVGHKLCRQNDLVINTMWAWMGALGVAPDTGIVSPAYGVYRPLPNSPLLPEYADLLLRTRPYIDEYTCRSTGIRSSRLRLYPDRFLTIPVVCPPPDEQRRIVATVRTATRGVEGAMAGAVREIELLSEYRQRLIAEVITGHRDVREEAARLADVDDVELNAVTSAASMDHDAGEEADEGVLHAD